jgi:hypothetical protein
LASSPRLLFLPYLVLVNQNLPFLFILTSNVIRTPPNSFLFVHCLTFSFLQLSFLVLPPLLIIPSALLLPLIVLPPLLILPSALLLPLFVHLPLLIPLSVLLPTSLPLSSSKMNQPISQSSIWGMKLFV